MSKSASMTRPRVRRKEPRRKVFAAAAIGMLLAATVAAPAAADAFPTLSVHVAVGDGALFSDVGRQVVVEAYDAGGDGTAPVVEFDLGEVTTGHAALDGGSDIDLPPGDYRLRAVVDGDDVGWYDGSVGEPIWQDWQHVGFSAPIGFAEAATVSVDANGDTSISSVVIPVHPEPNSILGGVFSDSEDAYEGLGPALDVGATVEVYQVGGTTPVVTATTGVFGVYWFAGLPAGDYEVRFAGTRTVTPEVGEPFEEQVVQWWPMQPSRATAEPVSFSASGGHWVGVTGNLNADPATETSPGERGEITGTAAVDSTVTLEPRLENVDASMSQALMDRVLEYDVHFADIRWFADGVEIPGATGRTLKLGPALEGAMLHAEFTDYVLFGALREHGSTSPVGPVAPSPLLPLNPAPIPTVSGNAIVGQKLTATVGTWGPGATTRVLQWERDGDPIPAATAAGYTLAADDLGAVITVTVTASKPGYATTERTSAPVGPIAAGTLTQTPIPSVKPAAPRVGQVLTVGNVAWRPLPVDLAYEWLRDGELIDGATTPTHTVTAADVGATIAVRVTGSKPGYSSVTRQSLPTSPVVPGKIVGTAPVILGTPQVGQTLSSEIGTWTPAGIDIGYEWLRGTTPIPGANEATYTLTAADAGAYIKVRVTGSEAGYTTLVKTSARVGKVLP